MLKKLNAKSRLKCMHDNHEFVYSDVTEAYESDRRKNM